MSSTSMEQQTIALAALFQAASLVSTLASKGDVDSRYTKPLIDSLFVQNPDSFGDIYGNPAQNLQLGLSILQRISSSQSNEPEAMRYALSLLHLERKLSSSPDMLNAIGEGIGNAKRQADHFSPDHENTIAALADLYKQTLSQLSFRIRVTGNPTYLQNAHTANQVRTLLLAGIRAAILWRQIGGRRWHLLLYRGRYAECSKQLLRANLP